MSRRPGGLRVALAAAGTAGAALAFLPAAQAAPPTAEPFVLTCADGSSTTLWVNGQGPFTPAHAFDSTATYVPVAFRGQTETLYAADGSVVDQASFPDTAHRGSHRADTTCAFSLVFPVGEGMSIEYSATVDVKVVAD